MRRRVPGQAFVAALAEPVQQRVGQRLPVQDNPGGIDPLLPDRPSEPFFTSRPVGKGTGLGLAVSHGLVNQMGGKLSLGNQQGGACFRIELPVG